MRWDDTWHPWYNTETVQCWERCHDLQHNDTERKCTMLDDIKHYDKWITTHSITALYIECHYAECHSCWVSQISPWCWVSLCWMSWHPGKSLKCPNLSQYYQTEQNLGRIFNSRFGCSFKPWRFRIATKQPSLKLAQTTFKFPFDTLKPEQNIFDLFWHFSMYQITR